MTEYREVSFKDIETNPYQPREIFPREKVEQLADSLKAIGYIEPGVGRWHPMKRGVIQLAAGAMRREAGQMAGLQTMPVVIRDLDDRMMALYGLAENVHRTDLTDAEKEKAYYRLWKTMYEPAGLTRADMAREIGIPHNTLGTYITGSVERRRTNASPKVSSYVLERVSAVQDTQVEKTLVDAIEDGKLTSTEVVEAVPTVVSAPSSAAKKAVVKDLIVGRKKAEEYVETVKEETKVRAVKGQKVLRRVSTQDESRLKKLSKLYSDVHLYARWSFVDGIKDEKVRKKAVQLLQDMDDHLGKQLVVISKRSE